MIRARALDVLARASESEEEDALEDALRSVDPLLRRASRRRVEDALRAAERMAPAARGAHLFQLAYLVLANGVPTSPATSAEAIRQEQLESRASHPAPSRRHWPTWTAVLLVLALTSGIAARALVERRFDPTRSPLGNAFARALPEYLVLLDRASSSPGSVTATELVRARQAATSEAVRRDLRPDGAARLAEVLDAAAVVAAADATSSASGKTDALFAAVGELDATLATNHLPYFVDADVSFAAMPLRAQPVLLSFYIEREDEALADGDSIRVLHLWRLDRLNFRQSFLGYTRPRAGAALVLLDQIEADLVTYVLPALPPGEEVQLIDDESLDEEVPWQKKLHDRAGEVVRAYVDAGTGGDRAAIGKLGELLARRRALVRKWRTSVAGLGLRLRIPERLVPEADYAKDLGVRVPREELREWEELHEQLLSPRLERAFVTLRDRYAEGVERHEVQHRLDYARGLIPVPPALAFQLGLQNTLDAPPTTLEGRSRDELSAYLAELGGTGDSPLLPLVLLSRFVFDESWLRDPYAYAAFVAIDEIARELEVKESGPLTARGRILRAKMAERFLEVLTHPAGEIESAARRAWERLYGGELPKVTRGRVVANAPWRH